MDELCKHVVVELPDSMAELDLRDGSAVTLYLTQSILMHYAVLNAYRLKFGLQVRVRTSLDAES